MNKEELIAAIESIPDHYPGGYEWEWDCAWRFHDNDRFPKCTQSSPAHFEELISRQEVIEMIKTLTEGI